MNTKLQHDLPTTTDSLYYLCSLFNTKTNALKIHWIIYHYWVQFSVDLMYRLNNEEECFINKENVLGLRPRTF